MVMCVFFSPLHTVVMIFNILTLILSHILHNRSRSQDSLFPRKRQERSRGTGAVINPAQLGLMDGAVDRSGCSVSRASLMING